jgi:HTH-type transcriptional repressor of NAD biosynthesis genes
VLATALWHERYVGEPAPRNLERAAAHQPALYVLTGDEIPFVQDGMRDGEHIRHDMQQRFREVLAAQPVPWVEVRGSVQERVVAVLPLIAVLRP